MEESGVFDVAIESDVDCVVGGQVFEIEGLDDGHDCRKAKMLQLSWRKPSWLCLVGDTEKVLRVACVNVASSSLIVPNCAGSRLVVRSRDSEVVYMNFLLFVVAGVGLDAKEAKQDRF